MGRFFKIFLNLSQRNLLKNLVILFKIWRKIGPIGILNGSLFLEKLVFVCVCCQIPLRHIPTKTKLECPLGLQISFELIEETYMVPVLFFTTNPWIHHYRVRGVDQYSGKVWKKREKKVSMSQNDLSLSERESSVAKWRCDISKMTTMRVLHGLRYKTCHNFSENVI